MRHIVVNTFAVAAASIAASAARAHDGHGAAGAHWHATDAWGFVLVGALVAAALWLGRRK